MRNLLIILVLLFGLLMANQIKAQDNSEPDITKYFPGLTWKDYITKKAVAIYADENNYVITDEMAKFIDSPEEDDSTFQLQLQKYFQTAENCKNVVGWVQTYLSAVAISVNYNEVIELIKDEFEDFLNPIALAELEKLKQ